MNKTLVWRLLVKSHGTALKPWKSNPKCMLNTFVRFLSTQGPRTPGPGGPSYMYTPSLVPYLTQTVGQVVSEAAESEPEALALVVRHQNIRKTYAQLDSDVDALAAGLLSLGLKKGDRVGIWGPNSYQWVLAQFAAARAGLILVTVNPAYQARELEYCLNKVQCRCLLTPETFKSQNYYKIVASVSPELEGATNRDLNLSRLPDLKSLVLTEGPDNPGTWNFEELMLAGRDPARQQDLSKISPQFDEAANIQFTSGTTGQPKPATLSHFNIVNNAQFIGRRLGFIQQRPRVCMQVPLYHCFGCVLGTLTVFLYRGTVVLPAPSFQPEATMHAISEEKCTVVYGTPTMFVDMVGLPDTQSYDCTHLKTGVMSGASCPEKLLQTVEQKLGIKNILIPYGCTETSPVVTLTGPSDSASKKLTTVGQPLDTSEVKVMDPTGAVVPVGSTGEVCLRGYMTFLGYWQQEDKTKEILTQDKWYLTGDIGWMDEDGYLHIVGRIKEMIIRGGENIYPREIEEFLMTHPQVADVHVCGVPDKRLGEEICAWVYRTEGGDTLDQQAIKEYCKGKISHFKIPKYIVFTKEFPKTVTGKVQKFAMREQSIKLLKLSE